MKSCGMSARFSAQSVSMIPSCGCSWAIAKPLSVQNWRTAFMASSGVALATIQRSLPARTMRASALALGAISAPLTGRVASRAAMPEAVATL